MRNITVAVPDEVYRLARIRAAEQDSSVSAMVTDFLRVVTGQDAEFNRLRALQDEVLASVGAFRGGDRLSREELHSRAVR
ncbi:MAG: hypothetical protein LBG11_03695 [Bifidobacteriaceae bacterium]|jgi:plasmid stability protein|nr:hypothetical protein [Bifidobacteriaceae bacterium]